MTRGAAAKWLTGLGTALLVATNLVAVLQRMGDGWGGEAAPVPATPAGGNQASSPATEVNDGTLVAELNEPLTPAAATVSLPRPTRAPADLVLLISVDGLREDAVFPLARNMHRLANEGTSAVNARTVSKASTLPSHASMVSGVDWDRHGLAHNSYRPEMGHIQYPTIFSRAQQAGLPTALFVAKQKLKHLLNPDSVGHFAVGGVYCSRVNALAVPHLMQAERGLVFVHFSEPDAAGHRHGWGSDEYAEAVRKADRCVGALVDTLKARGKLERTLLLLTADHGGHDHNHGSHRELDRRIPWVLWGGPAVPHQRLKRTVYNTDTAATILTALGLESPADMHGRPVSEAFAADPPAGDWHSPPTRVKQGP